jgi:hypothetical protein
VELTAAFVLGEVPADDGSTALAREAHLEASVGDNDRSGELSDSRRSASKIDVLGIVEVPQDVGNETRVELPATLSPWIEEVCQVSDLGLLVTVGSHVDDDSFAY